MPAYQFNVEPSGYALTVNGEILEWDLAPTLFISPLGLMTRGLVVGLGDQWQYSETQVSATWISSNTSTDPGWVVDDI